MKEIRGWKLNFAERSNRGFDQTSYVAVSLLHPDGKRLFNLNIFGWQGDALSWKKALVRFWAKKAPSLEELQDAVEEWQDEENQQDCDPYFDGP